MKLFAILTTTAALLLTSAIAAPVDSTSATNDSTSTGKAPQSAAAANYGAPQCKSDMMSDLCLSDNSHAYCDVTGFHNDFMKSCAGNCFCA